MSCCGPTMQRMPHQTSPMYDMPMHMTPFMKRMYAVNGSMSGMSLYQQPPANCAGRKVAQRKMSRPAPAPYAGGKRAQCGTSYHGEKSCAGRKHIGSSVGLSCSGLGKVCGASCGPDYYGCQPFDDIIIEEPRDDVYGDCFKGDATFVTRNFNQTRDPRGDIAVVLCSAPPVGASQSTQGPWALGKAYRKFVY